MSITKGEAEQPKKLKSHMTNSQQTFRLERVALCMINFKFYSDYYIPPTNKTRTLLIWKKALNGKQHLKVGKVIHTKFENLVIDFFKQ